ncbi:3-oxoacyl-[acyl-carrier-protein] synthase III C-terminal domain-containing protein [Conexibacter arvalis]|uniref:3-hydroxy-3-methylglutaryl CoA synthase/uncharacterized OB-fold protein n=1 Tax=Conexibacter arvalis TaxID=912552 RepID=A0A840I715_9ACTN|nr:3-hydroxy-3-methylglutaryl CoA synthase/uncharacterized OB-fold protein [Conexibacter arvalis]
MAGVISYGTHVPVHRLDAAAVRAAHGAGGGQGRRAVACFDEDTTTMGVEAARRALAGDLLAPSWIWFATSRPAYLEKTNAAAIHAALGLPRDVGATDVAGAVRSGAGALRAALQSPAPALAVLSDIRVGAPNGPDELGGGDGAAAFVATGGDEPVVAELIGSGAATEEHLDRWRLPEAAVPRRWEESFGAKISAGLAADATATALAAAGVAADDVRHLVVAAANPRARRAVARAAGVPAEALVDLAGEIGAAGAADAGLGLVAALDRAAAGETIVLLAVGDGVEALVFRATELLAERRAQAADPLARQLAAAREGLPYGRYLSWRGLIDVEPPRKAAPAPPAAPVAHRRRAWKFGIEATRCRACGTRQLPPQRVCHACRAVDRMDREPMREVRGRLVAHTVDRLAWSPSPPAVFGVVDFDGGGRAELELTETAPEDLVPGRRVALTFRVMATRDGQHNYFWKARPVMEED